MRVRNRVACEVGDKSFGSILGADERLSGKPVRAWVAQLVERVLGKDEVTGSIPVPGSSLKVCGRIGRILDCEIGGNERG